MIVRLKIIVRVEIRRAVRVGADGRWLLEEIAISQCRGRATCTEKVDVLLVAVVWVVRPRRRCGSDDVLVPLPVIVRGVARARR